MKAVTEWLILHMSDATAVKEWSDVSTIIGGVMATVRDSGQKQQSGNHNSSQIKKTHSPDIARDDLSGAYAGDENKGPAANEKTSQRRDSKLGHRNGRILTDEKDYSKDN